MFCAAPLTLLSCGMRSSALVGTHSWAPLNEISLSIDSDLAGAVYAQEDMNSMKTNKKHQHLTKPELQKFKKLLLAESDRLSEGLRRLEEDTLYSAISENTADIANCAEVGTDNFDRETALNIASGETDMLRDVADALRRVNEGSYGVCEGCNQPIMKKRLEVFPAARFCIECQSKIERRGYI